MRKTKEWTFRPQYTRARLINDLAEYEHQLAGTWLALARAKEKGKDANEIVFAALCMMQDFITDKRNETMNANESRLATLADVRQNLFESLLVFIHELVEA